MEKNRQEKIAEQIQKAEEQLRKLKLREAEIKKQDKQRHEREVKKWYQTLNKEIDLFMKEQFGMDYIYEIDQEKLLEFIKGSAGS